MLVANELLVVLTFKTLLTVLIKAVTAKQLPLKDFQSRKAENLKVKTQMKKSILLTLFVLLVGAGSVETQAQQRRYTERYNGRDTVSDRARIRRGVNRGQITRAEAERLRREQSELRDERRDVRNERREARQDGMITRDERRDIRQEQREYRRAETRQDSRINRARMNDRYETQRRGNGYYRRGAGSPTHPHFGSKSHKSYKKAHKKFHRGY